VNHLHQLLMELLPAGAEQKLTATKAKALLATVRPRAAAGKARRQLAVDLIDDLVTLDRKIKDINKRLKVAVEATSTSITDIKGVGITTAAGSWGRSVISGGSRASITSPATPAQRRSRCPPARSNDTAYPEPATASSTAPCITQP